MRKRLKSQLVCFILILSLLNCSISDFTLVEKDEILSTSNLSPITFCQFDRITASSTNFLLLSSNRITSMRVNPISRIIQNYSVSVASSLTYAAVSEGSNLFVVASFSKKLMFYTFSSGALVKQYSETDEITGLCSNKDSSKLTSLSFKAFPGPVSSFKVWSWTSPGGSTVPLFSIQYNFSFKWLRMMQNGSQQASIKEDTIIFIHELTGGSFIGSNEFNFGQAIQEFTVFEALTAANLLLVRDVNRLMIYNW